MASIMTGYSDGWIQVNNTVVPVLRRIDQNGDPQRLAPLPVIIYGANVIHGMAPTTTFADEQEIKTLNDMCYTAGIEFVFVDKVALIEVTMIPVFSTSEVIMLPLPEQDPFKHAKLIPGTNQAGESGESGEEISQSPLSETTECKELTKSGSEDDSITKSPKDNKPNKKKKRVTDFIPRKRLKNEPKKLHTSLKSETSFSTNATKDGKSSDKKSRQKTPFGVSLTEPYKLFPVLDMQIKSGLLDPFMSSYFLNSTLSQIHNYSEYYVKKSSTDCEETKTNDIPLDLCTTDKTKHTEDTQTDENVCHKQDTHCIQNTWFDSQWPQLSTTTGLCLLRGIAVPHVSYDGTRYIMVSVLHKTYFSECTYDAFVWLLCEVLHIPMKNNMNPGGMHSLQNVPSSAFPKSFHSLVDVEDAEIAIPIARSYLQRMRDLHIPFSIRGNNQRIKAYV